MDKFTNGITFLIGIPFLLLISWLVGVFFLSLVLKYDFEKGNKYLQVIISIATGIVILLIFGSIMDNMGCSSNDEIYIRR